MKKKLIQILILSLMTHTLSCAKDSGSETAGEGDGSVANRPTEERPPVPGYLINPTLIILNMATVTAPAGTVEALADGREIILKAFSSVATQLSVEFEAARMTDGILLGSATPNEDGSFEILLSRSLVSDEILIITTEETEPMDVGAAATVVFPMDREKNATIAKTINVHEDFLGILEFMQVYRSFSVLDVNLDGELETDTDGNIIFSVLFGLPPSDVNNYRGNGIMTSDQIAARVQKFVDDKTYDINEDGNVDASTDGNMINVGLAEMADSSMQPFRGSTSLTNEQLGDNVRALKVVPTKE